MKLAVPDMISNSYFPAIAAIELGMFEREGLDVSLELIFPVDKAYAALRDGAVDLVGGSAHSALAALGRNVEARHALKGMIPPIPDLVYREAWAFAGDSYRDRAHNGQDWMAWRAKYRGALKTEQEAYRAIAASSMGAVLNEQK